MRNRRLRRECREAMERKGASRPDEVIDEVLNSPVPKGFFVSVDRAVEVDRRHRAGTLPAISKGRGQMWEEIFRAIDRRLKQHGGTRLDAICYVIANSTASRFFLSRDEALRICRPSQLNKEDY